MIDFLHRLITYLFPKRTLIQRLPLAPRRYTSTSGERVTPEYRALVDQILGWGLARTEQDAMRLIRRYPDKTIREIRRDEHRDRKRFDRWKIFKARLKRLWDG